MINNLKKITKNVLFLMWCLNVMISANLVASGIYIWRSQNGCYRERESGNECTAVTRLRILKWRTKEKKRVWQLVLSTRSSNAIVDSITVWMVSVYFVK